MAYLHGHHGHNMVVLYLLFCLLPLVAARAVPYPWYEGCYEVSENLLSSENNGNPVDCAKHCLSESFQYGAIHWMDDSTRCACLEHLPSHNSTDDKACNERCGANLPCGGGSVMSVYKAAGPFIQGVSVQPSTVPVYEGQTAAIQVSITLAAHPNLTLGVPDERRDLLPNSYRVQVIGSRHVDEIEIEEQTYTHTVLHTFHHDGNIQLDIHVWNVISSVNVTVTQRVLEAVPGAPELTIITPAVAQRPPCVVPDSQELINSQGRTEKLYAGQTARFEAVVSVGTDLTFEWTFSGEANAFTDRPAQTESIMDYTFVQPGLYNVSVTVSSSSGTASTSLAVLVEAQQITDSSIIIVDDGNQATTGAFLPSSVVMFRISMVTNVRDADTYLDINFGDQSGIKTFSLATNQIAAGVDPSNYELDHLYLVESYTEECHLAVAIHHQYENQSVYNVTVRLYHVGRPLEEVTRLAEPVLVMNELTSPHITADLPIENGQSRVELGRTVGFDVTFDEPATETTTCNWSVTSAEGYTNQLPVAYSADDAEWAKMPQTFNKLGMFTISVRCTNEVMRGSYVSAEPLAVTVQEQISGAGLYIEGSVRFVRVDTEVEFIANWTHGSNVQEVVFDVKDPAVELISASTIGNMSATARHTYREAGEYPVTATISNLLGQVEVGLATPLSVQEPVEGLKVSRRHLAVQKDGTQEVEASLDAGTNARYEFDWGDGRRVVSQSRMIGYDIREAHTFTQAGTQYVKVYGFNDVSTLEETVIMEVQQAVGAFSVTLLVQVNVNERTLFVVRLDGTNDLNREDLIFTWFIDGIEQATTRAPVIQRTFTQTANPNVTVRAHNMVDSGVRWQTFLVTDAENTAPRFVHTAVATFGEPTEFVIKDVPRTENLQVLIKFRDGDQRTFTENTENSNAAEIRFTHNYTKPETVDVEATLTSQGSDIISTVISIQEPIDGLTLTGPTAIAVHGSPSRGCWRTAVARGSHVLHEWYINQQKQQPTVLSELCPTFNAVGTYNISVRVSNSLSQQFDSMIVNVQYPVTRATVTVPTTVLNSQSQVTIVVTGSTNIVMDVAFGEVDAVQIEGAGLQGYLQALSNTSDDRPRATYVIPFTFPDIGRYVVRVNVTNAVSSVSVSGNARVEEPITGVQIVTSSSSLVRLGSAVVVLASAQTGQDLLFDWDFGDQASLDGSATNMPDVTTTGRESRATYTYQQPGNWTVTVYISNGFYSNDPVTANLSEPFRVVQEIEGLTLQISGSGGVPIEHAELVEDVFGGLSTAPVYVQARVHRGSDVEIVFNLGNGQNRTRWIEEDNMVTLSYPYHEAGAYTISVSASNPLGTFSVSSARPFYVQEAPYGLQYTGYTTLERGEAVYESVLGEPTAITVTVDKGTDIMFDYDMGDGRQYVDQGLSVSHTYTSAGRYSVTVVAYNKVHRTSSITAIVIVIQPITGVELEVLDKTKQAYATAEEVIFNALHFPATPGLVERYEWYLGDPRVQYPLTSGSKMYRYSYMYPSIYTATVAVSNKVGRVTSQPIQVIVQSPISDVTIEQVAGEPVVGYSMNFRAFFSTGSNANYTWDFGDGNSKEDTIPMVEHTYTTQGEFEINLRVCNLLGCVDATLDNIFILISPCQPPRITFLGVQQNQDVRIPRAVEHKFEASVAIDCTITQTAVYAWTLERRGGIPNDFLSLTDLGLEPINDGILPMPKWTLEYGQYTIALEVRMNGTIVHNKASYDFEVVSSPLQAVIQGGTLRHVQHDETLVLDASPSYDPDSNVSVYDFQYSWTCAIMTTSVGTPPLPCLRDNSTLVSGARVLHINARDLEALPDVEVTNYLFNLTVMRPGRGFAWASQVIQIQPRTTLNVQLDCAQCADGMVNRDERLVLQAQHLGLSVDVLEFVWTVYVVQDGSEDLSNLRDREVMCAPPDGSYQEVVANNTGTEDENDVDGGTGNVGRDAGKGNNAASDRSTMASSTPTTRQPPTTPTTLPTSTRRSNQRVPPGGSPGGFPFPISEDDSGGDRPAPEVPTPATTPSPPGSGGLFGGMGLEEGGASSGRGGGGGGGQQERPDPFGGMLSEGPSGGRGSDSRAPSPSEAPAPSPSSFPSGFGPGEAIPNGRQPPSSGQNPPPRGSPFAGGMPPMSESPGSNPNGRQSNFPQPNAELPSMGEGPSGSARSANQGFPPITEGDPSQNGRSPGGSSVQPGSGGATGEQGRDRGGMANDGLNPQQVDPHVVNKARYVELIHSENTTTGLNNSNLVIKSGVLRQGITYIIELLVRTTDGRLPPGEGKALVSFRVNKSPDLGTARITPDHGVELDTNFKVFFSQWKDPEGHYPLRYEVSYTMGGESDLKEVLYSGLNNDIEFTLPAGGNIEIHLGIRDNLGAKTAVCKLPVRVVAKQLGSQNETEEEYLLRLVENGGALHNYISKGDHRQARLTMQNVVIILNRRHDAQAQTQKDIRCLIRNYVLNAIRGFPLRDEFETQQTIQTLVSSTKVARELIGEALRHAADITMATTTRALGLTSLNLLDTAITELSLKSISNVLAAVPLFSNQQDVDVKDVVYKARVSLDNVLNTVVHSAVMGEEPVKQESGDVFMCVGRYRTDHVPPLQTSSGSFGLPKDMAVILERNGLNISQSGDCWQAQMVSYTGNPFMYGKAANKTIQSKVPALTVNSCKNQQIEIKNLPEDQTIAVKIPLLVSEEKDPADLHVLHKDRMNVHPFNVSAASARQALHVNVELVPLETELRPFPIAILLSGEDAPYSDDVIIKREQYRADSNHATFFIPPGVLNASSYHLTVVQADYKAQTPHRAGEAVERTYSLLMWWGECLYWDEQTDNWSTDGCTIESSSTYTTTHCRCNHLTAFAARFERLKPNDLNLQNIDELFDLKENPVTIALIASLILLYILLLIIALRLDAHDQQKGAIVNIIDNSPDYSQKYLITMETGFRKAAVSTAKISMILHGEDGMSETRELISESGQPLFERNSRDTFIVMLPDSLGKILRIQLWHNNAGPSPSWYLSRVTVKDVNAGRSYYFNCEKWFSVDEEDGRIEREITVMEGGLGFYKVLKAKGTQYFTDYHLWFSSFTRPSYSNFTRAQRLTCCLALLMSYMAVNAAWYRRIYREYTGEFGLIDVSWRSLAVGVITSILVLPINFLITLIFRRSKIKRVRMEELPNKKMTSTGARLGESMMSMDSTTRLLHNSQSQSFFDQTIIHWATLQEWAKRQWNRHYQHSPASSTRSMKRASRPARPAPPRTYFIRNKPQFERRITKPSDTTLLPEHQARDTEGVSPQLQQLHEQLEKHALESAKSNKPSRVFLPIWCRYIAWTLSILIIVGCATITILYGISFGRTKSIMWLQSLFFSFLQCVFITHPAVILLYSLYTACKYHGDMSIFDHHDNGIIAQPGELSPRRRPSSPGFSDDELNLKEGITARQRSRYLRYLARPPQEKQLIEARKNMIRQKKTWGVFKEGSGTVAVLILLAVIAFGKNTNTDYNLNNALKTAFTKTGSLPFEKVRSLSDWWAWSETSLLDSLYWESWYNGDPTEFTPNVIGTSVLIGAVSLRQVRVKDEPCDIPYQKLVNPNCRYGYDDDNKETDQFVANETWYYGESYLTRSGDIRGVHGRYDGGGYQVILPRTRSEAYQTLKKLEAARWIDRRTRAVVVEMTLFNPATNLFSGVNLLLEIPPSGGVTVSAHVSSVYLYKYISSWDNFILACELLLVVAAFVKFHTEIGTVVQQKRDYIKNPWNCIEVALIIMLISHIGCYIYRYALIAETVELLRATYHEEYISVTFVAYWDQVLRSFVGFLLLVVLVQCLHLLRNQSVFVKFGAIYKKAAAEVVCAGVVMLVWLCAYTSLGMALYASITYDLHSWSTGLGTTSSLLVGVYNLGGVEAVDKHGLRAFVVSFLMFAVGSLTAYVFAVLSYHYKRQKVGSLASLTVVETVRMLWYRFLLTTGIVRPPRPENNDTGLPAEFTMAEIEYQVDEMQFKMNALSGTSGLPEKVPFYPTDSEPNSESLPGSELGYDDLRIANRIMRIEDNLMMSDHHLVQLLKLDTIGADALSEEKEKQLRSQLELEIFRQLQLTRVERIQDATSSGSTSDQTSSSYQRHLSTTSGTSSGFPSGTSSSSTCTPNASPAETAGRRRLPGLTFPKPPSLGALFPNDLAEDPNEDDVFNREEVVTPKDINVHSTLDGAIGEGEGDRSHDPLILHDLTDRSSGADTDGIPLHDMKPPASPSSSQDAETQEIMMRHDRKCSCGGSIRLQTETNLDDHFSHTGCNVDHRGCSLTENKLMGESKTNTMNGMSKLAQFRPKGSEFQEKPHSFQHVPASVKVSSSSGNASGSSSIHENDGKHPTSPADTEEDKHKRSHGNRSRDKSCNHGHHKQGHHKHHKCQHHHHHHRKHKKHRSRSRSQENKTIVTVVKDSSSASEGEGEKTQSGAKSRSTRKSKNRSKHVTKQKRTV